MLSLGVPARDKKGLGYTEPKGASTSKIVFLPASILGKLLEVNNPIPQVKKGKEIVSQFVSSHSQIKNAKTHTS